MPARLRHPGWLIVAQLAACWPVWRWYVQRMTDGSDEPLGILALLAALVLVWREWRNVSLILSCADRVVTSTMDSRLRGDDDFSTAPFISSFPFLLSSFPRRRESTALIQGEWTGNSSFILPALLLFLYAVTYPFSPPLLRAVFAVMALSATVSSLLLGVRCHLALTGLLLLSLPVVSSLQFYLGYPLRVLCGWLALPLLNLAGFDVTLEGTSLRCSDLLVSIDAPCSGIRMLWAGLFLTLALAYLYRLKARAVVTAFGISLFLLVMVNSLRTAMLFLFEVHHLQQFDWLHDCTGLSLFAFMGVVMILVIRHLAGERLCAIPASS